MTRARQPMMTAAPRGFCAKLFTLYIGIATKKGYLQSETSDFYYFTSSDIIGVWANLSKMRLDF